MKLEFIHKNETWNVGGFKKCECGFTKFSFSKGHQKARCESCGLIYDLNSNRTTTVMYETLGALK